MCNLANRARSAISISAGRKSRIRPCDTTCGVNRKWDANAASNSTPARIVALRL